MYAARNGWFRETRCLHVAVGRAGTCSAKLEERDHSRPARRVGKSTTKRRAPRKAAVPLKEGLKKLPAVDALVGWKVVLKEKLHEIGQVDEVFTFGIPPGDSYYLRVVDKAEGCSHLVPLVPDIVPGLISFNKQIVLDPPEGLLDLGLTDNKLEELKLELEAFMEVQKNGGGKNDNVICMPSEAVLRENRATELIARIREAGGFAEVAHRLGWRGARKPAGYWDNLDVLDQEVSYFIAGRWKETQDEQGRKCFYNTVSERVSYEPPEMPEAITVDDFGTTIFVEDEGDRVMPKQRHLVEAGRYDLHHAIVYKGGYKAVAVELGRKGRSINTFSGNVELELKEFMAEHSLNTMPTIRYLTKHDRKDLLGGIRQEGGHIAVAKRLGLPLSKNPRFSCADIESALDKVRQFLQEFDFVSHNGRPRMPTFVEIEQAGRWDLIYIMQKYGSTTIAQKLGLVPTQGIYATEESALEGFREFCQEHKFFNKSGKERMATQLELRQSGRQDLIMPLRKYGFVNLAKKLGLALSVGFVDMDAAAESVGEFLEENRCVRKDGRRRLPTDKELRKAGRYDLIGALGKYGRVGLARKLGVALPKGEVDV